MPKIKKELIYIKCELCNKKFAPKVQYLHYIKKRRFCSVCRPRYRFVKHWQEYQEKDGYKKCFTCKKKLSIDNFHKRIRCVNDGYNCECKKCISKRDEHRRLKITYDVIKHYSDNKFQCVCCGSKKSLTIDHIDHKTKNKEGRNLYRWLIKNNYPKGFQVLCHSCNSRKYQKGRCNCKELKIKYPKFAKIL